jgi:DoxX-like family
MTEFDTSTPGKSALWTGRVTSGLVIAFLIFDAVIKLVPLAPVTETLRELGFTPTDTLARTLGALTLACTVLYALPRTSALGAVLLTGYLGGATAIHVRAGSPVFSHLFFGLYLGAMLWAGLLLRDKRLRSVLFR